MILPALPALKASGLMIENVKLRDIGRRSLRFNGAAQPVGMCFYEVNGTRACSQPLEGNRSASSLEHGAVSTICEARSPNGGRSEVTGNARGIDSIPVSANARGTARAMPPPDLHRVNEKKRGVSATRIPSHPVLPTSTGHRIQSHSRAHRAVESDYDGC